MNRFNKRFVPVVVATVTLASIGLALQAQSTQPSGAGTTQPQGEKKTTPGGVTYVITRPGEGASNGDAVFIHYTGKFTDGTKFDSSYDQGEPISIILGQGQVIQGWEEGLQGMQVGERRTLTIPPSLGWGEKGSSTGKIPPNATVVFDVKLMGLQRK